MQQRYKILRIDPRFWLYFMAIGIFYLLGANTGSGWIFILAATFFTICTLSIVLPFFALSQFFAAVSQSEDVPVGTPALLSVHIQSGRNKNPEPQNSLIPLLVFLSAEQAKKAKSTLLPPHPLASWALSSAANEVICPDMKRGIYDKFHFQLQTAAPLGLIWWQKQITQHHKLVIYPQILPMHGVFLFKLAALAPLSSSRSPKRSAVLTTHIKDIRPYQRGDSPRDIHWSLSARHGKLLIKEYEREGLPFFDLVLAPADTFSSAEQLELALTAAASILAFGHQHALAPGLSLLANPSSNMENSQSQKRHYFAPEEQLLALAGLQFRDNELPSLSSQVVPDTAATPGERALVLVFPEGKPITAGQGEAPLIMLQIAARGNTTTNASSVSGTGMLNYLLHSAEELLRL